MKRIGSTMAGLKARCAAAMRAGAVADATAMSGLADEVGC